MFNLLRFSSLMTILFGCHLLQAQCPEPFVVTSQSEPNCIGSAFVLDADHSTDFEISLEAVALNPAPSGPVTYDLVIQGTNLLNAPPATYNDTVTVTNNMITLTLPSGDYQFTFTSTTPADTCGQFYTVNTSVSHFCPVIQPGAGGDCCFSGDGNTDPTCGADAGNVTNLIPDCTNSTLEVEMSTNAAPITYDMHYVIFDAGGTNILSIDMDSLLDVSSLNEGDMVCVRALSFDPNDPYDATSTSLSDLATGGGCFHISACSPYTLNCDPNSCVPSCLPVGITNNN